MSKGITLDEKLRTCFCEHMATEIPITKRKGLSWRQFLSVLIIGAFCYVASYSLDSFCGGYWLIPEMDGRDHLFSWGWALHNAFLWQPRFGHEARGDLDISGAIYAPLIYADRQWIHKTIYLSDSNGFDTMKHLSLSQVHPEFRDDYVTKITGMGLRDEKNLKIHCALRLTGSGNPRSITEIRLARNVAETLEISPPEGFVEKPFNTHQSYLQQNYIRWVGKIPLVRDHDVMLDFPSKHPVAGSGTMRFQCDLDNKNNVNHSFICYVNFGEPKSSQVH